MRSFITCTLQQNIIRMMTSRWMHAGHEACAGVKKNSYRVLVRKPGDQKEYVDKGERITLK
jgi:hypothetical protein